MQLSSKVAIVTGASSGIGKAFSKALIAKGAKVYGIGRNMGKLNAAQDELGNDFISVKLDITKHKEVETWVSQTFGKELKPDILINNAGLGVMKAVDELSVKEWDAMVNTNLSGVFYLTRMVVPFMKKNEAICHVINIASVAGLVGNPNLSGYNATKFGIRGFSEALFKELRYDGIKVSCMFPGSIATSFFDAIEEMEAHDNMMHADDVAQVLIQLLETPDNLLIDEINLRPLDPKPKK